MRVSGGEEMRSFLKKYAPVILVSMVTTVLMRLLLDLLL